MSQPFLTFVLSAATVSAASTSSAVAETRYVDASLATGANDGSSWADAFQGVEGLANALAAAASGDQIWVAAGTYKPTATSTRTISIDLVDGVQVYGGFAGAETSLEQRDLVANPTVLSGDLAGDDGSGIITDNSYHVVGASLGGPSTVLDGFTVTGGNADGDWQAAQSRGGGLICGGLGSPRIRACRFVANRSIDGGGACYVLASPTFYDCEFAANEGGLEGGAILVSGAPPFFYRCRFEGNQAERGGAIAAVSLSRPKLFNSLFHSNTATGSGGGGAIFLDGTTSPFVEQPLLRNCTIVANAAPVQGTGGLLVSNGAPVFTSCIVRDNTGIGGSTGSAAQLYPPDLDVTYSIVPAGYPGEGNIDTAPTYDTTCGPYAYRLAMGSAGVDAGRNFLVPALALELDLAGAPRFADVPSVPDTGSGQGPLIDIGAFEADPDCNGNGVSDWCDIAGGASLDANANGIPDDCECQGGTTPSVYCTAKINSQLCIPSIGFQGWASASNFAPFEITATQVLNQKSGLLFYGYQPTSAPFQGGILCVDAPIRRTPVMTSGGSPSGTDCTGTYSLDFNAYIAGGADPLLATVGRPVYAQYWSRDPQAPFSTGLTDALSFRICQ
jgi:predicted outer membrane repeat protein